MTKCIQCIHFRVSAQVTADFVGPPTSESMAWRSHEKKGTCKLRASFEEESIRQGRPRFSKEEVYQGRAWMRKLQHGQDMRVAVTRSMHEVRESKVVMMFNTKVGDVH